MSVCVGGRGGEGHKSHLAGKLRAGQSVFPTHVHFLAQTNPPCLHGNETVRGGGARQWKEHTQVRRQHSKHDCKNAGLHLQRRASGASLKWHQRVDGGGGETHEDAGSTWCVGVVGLF